jgi:hypothetical protein
VSPASLPGPGVDVEVCLGIAAIDPAGVWDQATWDYNTWTHTDTPLGDWSDVTCDVLAPLTLGAGSSPDGVVTRWEAATCAFTLAGSDWDPRSGPYTGLLGPALPVRVRWRPTGADDTAWATTFQGQTSDDGFTYDPKSRQAAVSATDGTAILAAFNGPEQSPQGAGETAAQRVARIADEAGWPADRRDITPGGVAVQATTLADAAWTMLLAVADTDLALLWINRAGELAYRPEGKVTPSHTPVAVIGCGVPPAPPPNLIDPESSGFEAGTVGHWSNYDKTALSNTLAQARTGVRSLLITVTADGDPLVFIGYPVAIPVVAGAVYDVAAWLYPTAAAHDVRLNVWWLDAAGGLAGATAPATHAVPGTWTRVAALGVQAPPGAVTVQLLPQPLAATAGETFYMDDVSMVDVTPPPPGPPTVDPVNIVGQQPSVTRNIVSVSRQAAEEGDTPATVTVRDDASVARFLAHSYSRTDLIHADDGWSQTLAQAILLSSAWPSTSPASVDLSSRADPAAAALLLTLEPSLSVLVTDGAGSWECEPAGWSVTITPTEIAGSVGLLDVSAWYGGSWDDAGWDTTRWGF